LTLDSKNVNKRSTRRGAKEQAKMAITVGKYHLFERECRGRTIYYYWYEDHGKWFKRRYKCEDKRTAVAYLEQLLKADLTETKRKTALTSITIKDFAGEICLPIERPTLLAG
jgi:hypothetical protein